MVKARADDRAEDALRPLEVTPRWLEHPAGSVLLAMGDTLVLCSASVEETVPPFLVGKGEGWVTAEYAMLPAATHTRSAREVTRGRPSGRTLEIQRLIGRSLRAVVDRRALGPRTVTVDCDVLQADGGTRTASITGGYLALVLALDKLGIAPCLTGMIAAISVGIVQGRPLLDLDYAEDAAADVDMNVVRTDDGRFVELQGTAEAAPFRRQELDRMLALADVGLDLLMDRQRQVLGEALDRLRA